MILMLVNKIKFLSNYLIRIIIDNIDERREIGYTIVLIKF